VISASERGRIRAASGWFALGAAGGADETSGAGSSPNKMP